MDERDGEGRPLARPLTEVAVAELAGIVDADPADVVKQLRAEEGGDIVVLASCQRDQGAAGRATRSTELSITLAPELVGGGGSAVRATAAAAASWKLADSTSDRVRRRLPALSTAFPLLTPAPGRPVASYERTRYPQPVDADEVDRLREELGCGAVSGHDLPSEPFERAVACVIPAKDEADADRGDRGRGAQDHRRRPGRGRRRRLHRRYGGSRRAGRCGRRTARAEPGEGSGDGDRRGGRRGAGRRPAAAPAVPRRRPDRHRDRRRRR